MAGRWDVTVDVSRGGQRLGSRQFAVVARSASAFLRTKGDDT